jgi:membrane protease YdiL (CAAX protease family)/N-acetylneuraminic acid mutarotase
VSAVSALISLAVATVAGDIGTLVGQIVFAFCILLVAIWGQISQGNRALKMGQDIAFGFFAVFVWFIGMAQLISGRVSGLALVVVTLLMGTALVEPVRKATWARILPIEPESRMHMLGLICLLFAVAIFFLTSASVADTIDQPTDQVSVYDPSLPKPASGIFWSAFDPLPAPRKQMGFVADGATLYVIGGEDTSGTVAGVEAYNLDLRDHPVAGQVAAWTPRAPLPEPRSHLAVVMLDGKLYAFGGERGGSPVPTGSVYDPATNTWSTLPPLPEARTDLAAAVVNRKIYALGGTTSGSATAAPAGLTTVSIYDPATRQWAAGAPMPTARSGLAAVTLGGKIYALGGQEGGTSLKSVEVYDPQANTWTAAPSLRDPRSNLAVATRSDTTIYALGGFGSGETSNSVQVFDVAAGKWTGGPAMVTGGAGLGAATVAGKIYAAGGAKDQLGQIVPHGGIIYTIGEALVLAALAVALVGVGVRRTRRLATGPARPSRAAIAANRGVIASSAATAEREERFIGGVRFALRRTPAEIRERLGLAMLTPLTVLIAIGTTIVLVGVAIGGERLTELLSPTIAANVDRINAQALTNIGGLGAATVAAIVLGMSEELLFRGAIQPRYGVFLTALAFAGLHTQYGFGLAPLTVFAVGLVLGIERRYTNTSASILSHVLFVAAMVTLVAKGIYGG